MPTPVVVADIARFLVKQTFSGVDLVNVIDMFVSPAGGASRADVLPQVAANIWDAWYDEIRTNQANEVTVTGIEYIDLDSPTGSTGEITGSTAHAAPFTGSNTDPAFPSYVAVRVKKSTGSARGSRAGSMFIAGTSELVSSDGAPNEIGAANVTIWNTDLAAFLDKVTNNPVTEDPDYNSFMVVVHKSSAGVFSASEVSSLSVVPKLTHQKRRKQ